ncbi:MAG: acyl-CoA dehydrogenase family protein [Rhodospirillaceae bacterium]
MSGAQTKPAATAHLSGADWIAPDCHGANFYDLDPGFRALLKFYLPPDLHAHMTPHLERLGALAGGKLDELARIADRHGPVLHDRDRFGRDEDWIEYHPAYKEMERMAYEDFALNRMSHRPGAFRWPAKLGPLVKYAVQYLFVQAEFGLMCPISATDTSAYLVDKYATPEIHARYFPRMTAEKREDMVTGAQFMTEQSGGSDVGNIETEARLEDGVWRIYGDKWFCSTTDGGLIMMLARCADSPWGSRGLSLFAVPRTLEDGSRNAYAIRRLKNKLGSKSMASGEVTFHGAEAYLLGRQDQGLKHMLDMVNLSRLSHGVRAAAMMRRCLNETMAVARNRFTFGERIVNHPLMRRQIMKTMLPTEQALSAFMFTASVMEKADAGDEAAARALRIITPMLKGRACRDNVKVATAAMEARGGNGYIEEWVNARLVRDAHLGVVWEGTSSIVALDVTKRAIPKARAHEALGAALHEAIESEDRLPGQFRGELSATVDRAVRFAEAVAEKDSNESFSRQASNALYHAMTAVLLAREGVTMGEDTGDARRLLMSRLVVDHKLRPHDPMSLDDAEAEGAAAALLLDDEAPTLDRARKALAA